MPPSITWDLSPADETTFTGEAYSRLIASAEVEAPTRIYFVRFEAAARTYWHAHPFVQILLITTGICRYQRAGGPVEEASSGQSVRFEPGELHWHGAAPHARAEHLAINLGTGSTKWETAVSESDFLAVPP